MGLFFLLALGAALFVLCASIGTAWFLTHPPRRTLAWALAKSQPADPSQLVDSRAFRDWSHTSRGHALRVWDIAGDRPDGPTVILTHGWGDSRLGGLARTPTAARFASRVVVWDLPGHGDSTGICSLGTREVADLLSLIDQLPPGDVILWGWSLGAGVSLSAAVNHPRVTGVICESCYRLAGTPAANVLAARQLPWRMNLPLALGALGTVFGVGPRWRGFDRREIASKLAGKKPVLTMHGGQDIVCPLTDADAINTAAHGQMAVIPAAGHNDLWSDPAHAAECEAQILAFIAREAGGGAASSQSQ